MTQFAERAFLEDIRLIRQTAGSRNEYGEYVPGTETATDMKAATNPVQRGSWADILPEGTRLSDYREFHLAANAGQVASVRSGTDQTEADIIEYRGVRYAVQDVEDYVAEAAPASWRFVSVLAVRPEAH